MALLCLRADSVAGHMPRPESWPRGCCLQIVQMALACVTLGCLLSCVRGPSWCDPHWACDCGDFQAWLFWGFLLSEPRHQAATERPYVVFPAIQNQLPGVRVNEPPNDSSPCCWVAPIWGPRHCRTGISHSPALSRFLAHRVVNIMKWLFFGSRFGMVCGAAVVTGTQTFHLVVNLVTWWCHSISPQISIGLPKCLNHCVGTS